MNFGYTTSALLMGVVLFLMGWATQSGEMGFTRAAAPVMFMLVVLIPVFIALDLWKYYQWRKLARQASGLTSQNPQQQPHQLGSAKAQLPSPPK
jgi:hypothetical protein